MSGKRTGSLGVATTKGDLYTLDANSELVRLGVGADGTALIASAAAAGGLAWAYPQTSAFYPPQYANAFGKRRVNNIATGGGLTQVTVHVPVDFQSLTGLFLRFILGGNVAAKTVTIGVNASLPTQLNTSNPAGPTGFAYTINAGIDSEIDISSLVSGFIAAEMIIGVEVANTDSGTTLSIEGIILKYRRKLIP